MNGIKPIETHYKGYRFRSRLEARWAVFFDAMEINYMYEPEGFERCGYRYLPDFYFPDYRVYGEVKGATRRGQIPKADAEKMSWMIDLNGPCANGIIILGDIPVPDEADSMCYAIWRWDGKGLSWGYIMSNDPDPDYVDVLRTGRAPEWFPENDDLALTTCMYGMYDPLTDRTITDEVVASALRKARSARFEHGETPQQPGADPHIDERIKEALRGIDIDFK